MVAARNEKIAGPPLPLIRASVRPRYRVVSPPLGLRPLPEVRPEAPRLHMSKCDRALCTETDRTRRGATRRGNRGKTLKQGKTRPCGGCRSRSAGREKIRRKGEARTRCSTYLPNTCQIDGDFVRFVASTCAMAKSPILIGKSSFQRLAAPLGFEPRITPPKGAVLPLHHRAKNQRRFNR